MCATCELFPTITHNIDAAVAMSERVRVALPLVPEEEVERAEEYAHVCDSWAVAFASELFPKQSPDWCASEMLWLDPETGVLRLEVIA